MTELRGRTIVVTGAASGLGRAWTLGFLDAGARVVAADIVATGLVDLEARGALTIVADVARAHDVKATIDLALGRTGRLDALFNNAGLGFRTRIEDLADDEFERHVAVHLFGTVSGMRFAIPAMRRQGHGRIVNTISRAAEAGSAGNSAYAAAKAAIWAATRSAAAETAGSDVLVNMLIPGPTNTAIWGRDMPRLQAPEVTFPTARMLATLPSGGPSGKVFWNEREYPMFRHDLAPEG
jgi:NAD(P)-dependent dehydrogenase (short-subunit alcohol dehydrogenase family)